MTRFHFSRIPERKENMPACSRSAHTISARGQGHRTVCLIPASAHGTNPASAHMAGMDVVVVRCNDRRQYRCRRPCAPKQSEHADRLAAIMITYPSTHGVFEEEMRDDLRHRPRSWWPSLSRWRQSERAGRLDAAGGLWRGRRPSQSAQDVLHPAWRRRAGHGADRREIASRAVPAGPSGAAGRTAHRRAGIGRTLRLGVNPCDPLALLPDDGRRRSDSRRPRSRSSMPITSPSGSIPIIRFSTKDAYGRVAHECIIDLRAAEKLRGHQRRRCCQTAHRLRLSRADDEFSGCRNADDRADGIGIRRPTRPVLRRDDCNSRGNSSDRAGAGAAGKQSAEERAAYRARSGGRSLATARIPERRPAFPEECRAVAEILVTSEPDRQRLRRSQSDLLVPAA